MHVAAPAPRIPSRLVAALAPWLLVPASALAQSPACELDQGLARARDLAERGEPAAAASLLEELTACAPDDYDLYLLLGWYHARAEHPNAAVRHYARAVALSQGNPTAWLGLGWARLAAGDREGAAAAFEAALRGRPEDRSAHEGLRLSSRRALSLAWSSGGALSIYDGHPFRTWSTTFDVGARLLVDERLEVHARYRGTAFELAGDGPYSQHEGHFALGWRFADDVALLAHYAALGSTDALGDYGSAHAFGAQMVFTGLGRLSVEASATVWPDQVIGRVAARWALPLGEHVFVAPQLSAQWVDEQALGTAGVGLGLELAPVSLWVGGRFGEAQRETSLALAAIDNRSDRVLGGTWASLSIALSDSVALTAAYEWERLSVDDAAQTGADAHTTYLRLGGSF